MVKHFVANNGNFKDSEDDYCPVTNENMFAGMNWADMSSDEDNFVQNLEDCESDLKGLDKGGHHLEEHMLSKAIGFSYGRSKDDVAFLCRFLNKNQEGANTEGKKSEGKGKYELKNLYCLIYYDRAC